MDIHKSMLKQEGGYFRHDTISKLCQECQQRQRCATPVVIIFPVYHGISVTVHYIFMKFSDRYTNRDIFLDIKCVVFFLFCTKL